MLPIYRRVVDATILNLRRGLRFRTTTKKRLAIEEESVPKHRVDRDYPKAQPAPASADWSLMASCITGSEHQMDGILCQDAFASAALSSPEALIIAVSDGAGSARYAEQGSRLAVDTVVANIEVGLRAGGTPSTVLKSAYRDVRLAIEQAAVGMTQTGVDCAPRDLACTLIVTVLFEDRLWLAQVGDGAVVICNDGALECLSPFEPSEYVNETQFVTTRGRLERLEILDVCSSQLSSLAVMTDSVEHLSIGYSDRVPLGRFFNPIFEFAQRNQDVPGNERNAALANFLNSDLVNAETDDDKTLIVVTRRLS